MKRTLFFAYVLYVLFSASAIGELISPATQLEFIVSPTDTIAAETLAPAAQVEIQDALGDKVASNAIVEIAILAGTGRDGAVLSGVASVAAVNGVATFDDLSINLANLGGDLEYKLEAASDGLTSAESDAFSITDNIDPEITLVAPDDNPNYFTLPVPLDTLIPVRITDVGAAVDVETVEISLDTDAGYGGAVIYDGTGSPASYDSALGTVKKTGSGQAVTFSFQPAKPFKPEQELKIDVTADDAAGNSTTETFTLRTAQRSFGWNLKANDVDTTCKSPRAAVDADGNIFVVWAQVKSDGYTEIRSARLQPGNDSFDDSKVVASVDDRNLTTPAIAIYTSGGLKQIYVVWQDYRDANWNIYSITSPNGTTWDPDLIKKVNATSTFEQELPRVAVDSTGKAYVTWQDNRNGDQDIYIASSTDNGDTWTETRVTENVSHQTEPDIAIDGSNVVYLAWTDARNSGRTDIYGANSSDGWSQQKSVVSNANDQLNPVIAAESGGTIHMAWTDETAGDYDIYYESFAPFPPATPATGAKITDDTTDADQTLPAIAIFEHDAGVTYPSAPDTYSVNATKVFVAWEDERDFAADDNNIYYAETSFGGGIASWEDGNICLGDYEGKASQTAVSLAIDNDGLPFAVWSDARSESPAIAYSMAISSDLSDAIAVRGVLASAVADTVVGQDDPADEIPQDDTDALAIIPPGSLPHDMTITIMPMPNHPAFPAAIRAGRVGDPYDFGPSGVQFLSPVTVRIPHATADCPDHTRYRIYHYRTTGDWSTSYIAGVHKVSAGGVHYVEFTTTHFTMFGVVGVTPSSSGGGGGGGCFIATAAHGSPLAEEVRYLRAYRDNVLMKTPEGRAFVEAYYMFSPPVAEVISESESLKAAVRTALKPLVEWSKRQQWAQ